MDDPVTHFGISLRFPPKTATHERDFFNIECKIKPIGLLYALLDRVLV